MHKAFLTYDHCFIKNDQKCWWWLATFFFIIFFFLNAGEERVNGIQSLKEQHLFEIVKTFKLLQKISVTFNQYNAE